MEYLVKLRAVSPFDRIAIFMDNLTVHKTRAVKEKMEFLKIEGLYNVPYQPDFSPCESCNQILKHHYKMRKFDMLLKEENFDPKRLI